MFYRRLSVFLLAVAEFGCQKKAVGPPPRHAFVRFENLSKDSALDWVGRAASETLSVTLSGVLDGPVLTTSDLSRLAPSLGGRPSVAPGVSAERAEAMLAGATRLITGYIEQSGATIRIVAVESDLASGKTLRTETVADGAPMAAIAKLAQAFNSHAKPYLTSNPVAFEHYFKGVESRTGPNAAELQQAIDADPNFGPAWIGSARLSVIQGNREAAEARLHDAQQHKLDPGSQANVEFELASLHGDQTARLAALRKIAALSPGDNILLRTLADTEMATGQFPAAAADWKKLADLAPNDPTVWNSLGYARSYAGDLNGALDALRQYAKIRPAEANPLDSTGDVYYYHGKFPEAAASYLQAQAKDPNFQRSGALYKAAWAKFYSGDKPGADKLFSQFKAAREKAGEVQFPFVAADWLYRTGHPDAAMTMLRGIAATPDSPLSAQASQQIVIWDLISGDRAKAAEDSSRAGAPTTAATVLLRFIAQPSAPADEWQARADRLFAGPALAGLKRIALGYALILDNHRQEAIPVCQEIVTTTPSTDFFSRALLAKLTGQPNTHPIVPDPNSVNQYAELLD